MQAITTVGLDIAKSVFQVHGVDAGGQVVIQRQLKRRYLPAFFQKLPHAWSESRLALHRTIGRGASGAGLEVEGRIIDRPATANYITRLVAYAQNALWLRQVISSDRRS